MVLYDEHNWFPHKVSILGVPLLVAPWIWWVVCRFSYRVQKDLANLAMRGETFWTNSWSMRDVRLEWHDGEGKSCPTRHFGPSRSPDTYVFFFGWDGWYVERCCDYYRRIGTKAWAILLTAEATVSLPCVDSTTISRPSGGPKISAKYWDED